MCAVSGKPCRHTASGPSAGPSASAATRRPRDVDRRSAPRRLPLQRRPGSPATPRARPRPRRCRPRCRYRGGFVPSPTPPGVPVAITSPGSSVVAIEQYSTSCTASKMRFDVFESCIVSPETMPLTLEVRRGRARRPRDRRADGREGVEALAPRELAQRRLELAAAPGDVVEGRDAADRAARVGAGGARDAPADDERPARPRSPAASPRAGSRSSSPGPITAVGHLAKTTGTSGIASSDSAAWSR